MNQVKEFVNSKGGTTVITRILIANNGMAAVKAIRSIRKWSYETFGSERQIQFTAMSTPEDLEMNAEYIRMADSFIQVPGGSSHNNYANVDLIVDVAEQTKVDAVYVGWGFASENPVLAERLAKLNPKVVFIGPPPSAMRSLGDKIASTIVAQSANVPCVNWSGSGLIVNGTADVSPEIYSKATINNVNEGLAHAEKIGFPCMIKASEGGGGKGIRLVYQKKDFASAFLQVQREVAGSPIFIMQVVENARHLEVQLLADVYGNAIALFGRDCSVQRRHQKIIEEAPVTIAPPKILRSMEQAAVNLAKLVGYTSAGTVEYLYEPSTQKYYFLELNPRLQVEHPTTEMVSGVNIPAAQLQVAMGIPLSNIKDIRILYGLTPTGKSQIDFDFESPESEQIQRRPEAKGHVIATRITAENPEAGFKPNSGRFFELNFKSNSNVWGYFSVNAAGGVHEYADSQFGHLFAYGETREEARRNLVVALKEISIRGSFRTTVEYLVKLLEHPDFQDNKFTTSWLDHLISQNLKDQVKNNISVIPAICGAVSKAFVELNELNANYLSLIGKGQVPSDGFLSTRFLADFIINNLHYKMEVYCTGPESFYVLHDGQKAFVEAKALADGGILLIFDGQSQVVYIKNESYGTSLVVDGSNYLMEKENDPSHLKSPSPGKLVRYLVKDGERVHAGEVYAEIEVMKMYLPLISSESGIFTSKKPTSSLLATGDLIGTLVLDEPSSVKKAVVFEGSIPFTDDPLDLIEKPHHRLKKLQHIIDCLIAGYEPYDCPKKLLKLYMNALKTPRVEIFELVEALGAVSSRIPSKLYNFLYETLHQSTESAVNLDQLESAMCEYLGNENDGDELLKPLLQPLLDIISKYRKGPEAYIKARIVDLLAKYLEVECLFEKSAFARVILNLRDTNKSQLINVLNIARSHSKKATRGEFIVAILDYIEESYSESDAQLNEFTEIFEKLAALSNQKVSLRAREILLSSQLPNSDQRKSSLLRIFSKAAKKSPCGTRIFFDFSQLSKLIVSRYPILDIVPDFFFEEDQQLRAIALYTYVMRTNQGSTINSFEHHFFDDSVIFTWNFSSPMSVQRYTDMDLFEEPKVDSPTTAASPTGLPKIKKGILFACESLDDIVRQVKLLKAQMDKSSDAQLSGYVTVALKTSDLSENDSVTASTLASFVKRHEAYLSANLIKRVTFMVHSSSTHSRYFTFKASKNYEEDLVVRHVEPFLANRLELERMLNFEVKPCSVGINRSVRVYQAAGKQNPTDTRLFVRGIIHPATITSIEKFVISEASRILNYILTTLELLSGSYPNTDCNHILLHFIPIFDLPLDQVQIYLEQLLEMNQAKLCKLRVTEIEVCFISHHPKSREIVPFRVIIDIPSEFVMKVSWYVQEKDKNGNVLLQSLNNAQDAHHGKHVYRLHAPKQSIHPKRYKAHLLGTTYVYDFPELFEQGIKKLWADKGPKTLMKCKELRLGSDGELEETNAGPGTNVAGMVVFKMDLYTPEYPAGRPLIVIANDITFQMGSFGTTEDLIFLKASQLARKLGVPRIYISANSGARIGLAEEVLSKYKIAWCDSSNPSKGFDYLYLSEKDYESLSKDSTKKFVDAQLISVDGENRYRLGAIIGQKHGLGVENLQGSGMIAGETSKAYQDIFTLTLVTCRSVGIGAYLVRLGQRVIQVDYSPIILTGAAALNKVLGRQVYNSNLQLGGPRIMYHNGVSHLVAQNDFNGVIEVLKWLSYVPKMKDCPLPVTECNDPIDRKVVVNIPSGPYDPRSLLQGEAVNGVWKAGFFDKGSFTETLGGWAKGIVVGRARLGGIPMGVISVETRLSETVVWADPAIETSQEETIKEAGQVWYSNSAYKTAQAIQDFNNGEQLPLIIFANWRGFSGGQSDMSKEVLKFGAKIVDALTNFKQPIFIYIVGELRGGAWVVIDPSINPQFMEMYCYENARGGVLEPQGIVEIKYRTPKIISTMERLDPEYRKMKESLAKEGTPLNKELSHKINCLEKEILPVYEQAAVELADLHDRPSRMLEKNVVKKVIHWETSREFFYWRLSARLQEIYMAKEICKITNQSLETATDLLQSWLRLKTAERFTSDQEFVEWIRENRLWFDNQLGQLKNETLMNQLIQITKAQEFKDILGNLDIETKERIMKALK